ncbi:MAG TPA: alpha-amylase family glycosyl hydrolase [Polyangia bacterium]
MTGADDGQPMTHSLLYQVNTRVFLQERGGAINRNATLDDVPDAFIDDVAARGFTWIWWLGVWQTGAAGREISRADAKLRAELQRELPDLRDQDITGSPFAITAYRVHEDFGGDGALRRLRERLARRGLKLLLDFVPNHTARDHRWVDEHPEYYVHGSSDDLARQPQNYARVPARRRGGADAILAYGRDPYFDGWSDTFQLNYRHAGFREAQVAELGAVADRCDGVRCDMAMLLQPQIIERTWGERARPNDGSPPRDAPFWREAIAAIRRRHPQFLFVAEVYWDMEWELQQAGFDQTYDKRLYDRLHAGEATAVREHLWADGAFQDRSLRFLENHDEPRAAAAFPAGMHEAAAVVAFTARGLRFFHEGQLEGRRVHVSMHVGRRPAEPVDERLQAFYARLLPCLRRPELHDGEWSLASCREAWEGNPTYQQFIVSSWQSGERRLIVAVNYGPTQAQTYAKLALSGVRGRDFTLVDLMSDTRYRRAGDELAVTGLYLDLPAWGYNIFELQPTR